MFLQDKVKNKIRLASPQFFFPVNLKSMPVNIFAKVFVNILHVPVNTKMKMCPWTLEVRVNRQKSAREFLKCPWTLSEKIAREPQKCPWPISKKSAHKPPQTAREQVLPASVTVVGNYVIWKFSGVIILFFITHRRPSSLSSRECASIFQERTRRILIIE